MPQTLIMTSVETPDVVPRSRYDAAVIKKYRILDTRPERAFDNITRLMTNIFDVQFAIISIIAADRVFFKANSGIGTAGNLPPDNILTRLIKKYSDKPVSKLLRPEQPDAYAGPDAALSSLKFYASVPLLNREGYKIGVISIADNRRKNFRKKEKIILENMAAIVMDEIELRKATIEETEKLLAINEPKKELKYKPKYLVVDAPAALGVIVGSDLIIESANNELLGIWCKNKDVIGKPLREVLPASDELNFVSKLSAIFETGEAFSGYELYARYECEGSIKEGYFDFVYYPIKDDKENVISILIIGVEVTEKIHLRDQADYTEKRMKMAIEAAGLGTCYIDPVSRSITASAKLKEIFGYLPEEDMTVDSFIQQIDESFRERVTISLTDTFQNMSKLDVEFSLNRKNDEVKTWVWVIGTMYPKMAGIPAHFSGTVLDISERKKNEELKNDFIAMVSHDLRNPLAALSANVQNMEMFLDQNISKETKNTFKKVYQQVDKMTQLLNGYLDISLIDAGKLHILPSEFNIKNILESAIQTLSYAGYSKAVLLECPDTLLVTADKIKLEQVVVNLLGNALKYAKSRKPVRIKAIIEDNSLIVSVKDEGIGLTAEEVNRLFEKFYRTDSGKDIPGFGVGLYICYEIIKSHKGKIWAESTPGEGSVFYFRIPVVPAE